MMIKKLLPLMLVLSIFVSCDMDSEPFLYRGFMMGFLQEDGTFKGDDGRTYIFNNISAGFDWKDAHRLFALFDVTEEMADGRYSANLLDYTFPLYKEPLKSTEVENPETIGPDPIDVEDAWFSGGCINMSNLFRYRADGEALHTVNLLVDLSKPVTDTLHLVVKHDAGSDRLDTDIPPAEYNLYQFYSSFPVASFFPEDKEAGVIEIKWTWEEGEKSMCNKVNLK